MTAAEPEFLPWPKDPWNEIVPGLFMGGQICRTMPGDVARVTGEFDTVYSLFWRDDYGCGPDEGVRHIHKFIPDGELTAEELGIARDFGASIARRLHLGEKVLVRCQAGYNRSGLVVAFALLALGYDAHGAIALIRRHRSPHALHNEAFIRYITEAGS